MLLPLSLLTMRSHSDSMYVAASRSAKETHRVSTQQCSGNSTQSSQKGRDTGVAFGSERQRVGERALREDRAHRPLDHLALLACTDRAMPQVRSASAQVDRDRTLGELLVVRLHLLRSLHIAKQAHTSHSQTSAPSAQRTTQTGDESQAEKKETRVLPPSVRRGRP